MKRFLLLLIALACISSCASGRLTIIHLNDTHSNIDPLRSGQGAGLGGVIERAAIVDSIRAADGKSNVLLLHAGDFSQGSSYFTEMNGDLEITLLNTMRYDCVCLGNHEFDRGLDDLSRRLANLRCPVVCANYDFSSTPLEKYVRPYAILHRAGMKIGVIGVLADISTVVGKGIGNSVPMLDTVRAINEWASYLKRDKSCDMVIMLSHVGFETLEGELSDKVLIPQTSDVDIVVGGHTHTIMDRLECVGNASGKEVPVVQVGKWGVRMGVLSVTRN